MFINIVMFVLHDKDNDIIFNSKNSKKVFYSSDKKSAYTLRDG